MVHAAKAMAATGLNVITDPLLLKNAKAALAEHTSRTPYICPLGSDVSPPLDMSRG
jgi:aminobenzoyl-glutamate utilization protein B